MNTNGKSFGLQFGLIISSQFVIDFNLFKSINSFWREEHFPAIPLSASNASICFKSMSYHNNFQIINQIHDGFPNYNCDVKSLTSRKSRLNLTNTLSQYHWHYKINSRRFNHEQNKNMSTMISMSNRFCVDTHRVHASIQKRSEAELKTTSWICSLNNAWVALLQSNDLANPILNTNPKPKGGNFSKQRSSWFIRYAHENTHTYHSQFHSVFNRFLIIFRHLPFSFFLLISLFVCLSYHLWLKITFSVRRIICRFPFYRIKIKLHLSLYIYTHTRPVYIYMKVSL